MDMDEQLSLELQSHYGVGPQYANAYLDSLQQSQGRAFKNLQEILNLPPPAPMWFDYAMSTNYRGRQIYQLMGPYLPERPQRYLDIGCGFGGCLVAFGEQGIEVYGIEVDKQRIGFAKINCQDYQIHANILALSVGEDHIGDRLGTFDIITCTDVIEHVLDVPKILQNMAHLLKPSGVLALEIPNKDSLFFVASDGHFNLFGITLLPQREATEYHGYFFPFEYDVGCYYPLDFYEAELRRLGLQPQIISSTDHPMREVREMDELFLKVLHSYLNFTEENRSRLPEKLMQRVKVHFATYMNHLLADFSKIPEGPQAVEDFRKRYLMDFWTIIACNQ